MTGINSFSYSKVYPDGSRMELWSDSQALYHIFVEKKYLADCYTPNNYDEKNKYLLLEKKIEDCSTNIRKKYYLSISAQRNIFDHDNCFMIINKKEQLCEYFLFYTSVKFLSAINFYFNNITLLESFSAQFREEAKGLIIKADNDRLIKPWRDLTLEKSEDIKKTVTPPQSKRAILTEREYQIAQHILEGLTARESANILCLSRRSIETHIENIKNKLGCNKKTELALKVQKLNILSKDKFEE
jgi:DNA-binding CsgD family transcriptional regulator